MNLNKFEDEVNNSAFHSTVYDYRLGIEYVLGFKKHKGMVSRSMRSKVSDWLRRDLWRYNGKTCILNVVMNGNHEFMDDLCGSTVLSEVLCRVPDYSQLNAEGTDRCIYTPVVTVVNHDGDKSGNVNIITCQIPFASENDEKAIASMYNRSMLVLHTAACNKIDNLIIGDYAIGMSENDVRWVARMFKNMSALYDSYLSNVFYLVSDERNINIYREEIGR